MKEKSGRASSTLSAPNGTMALVAALLLAGTLLACEGVTNTGNGTGDPTTDTSSGSGDPDVTAAGEDTPPVCTPACEGKECGDDGCGGSCGECQGADETCQQYQCVGPVACTEQQRAVNCAGRQCGGDGCGGVCGDCGDGQTCDLASAQCECVPDCGARVCGADPLCGQSCGECDEGSQCTADGACEAAYPPGPYGTEVGDTIDNLTFYTAEGRSVKLEQFFGQEKVIILTSAAGWCSVCRDEAVAFDEFHGLYDSRGLIIVYTLFEDDRGNPITPEFVQTWIDYFDLDYPVYQDRDFAMLPFYDQDATPLNMVVTTKDMQIRYREVGYSDFQVTYWAKKYMFENAGQ